MGQEIEGVLSQIANKVIHILSRCFPSWSSKKKNKKAKHGALHPITNQVSLLTHHNEDHSLMFDHYQAVIVVLV